MKTKYWGISQKDMSIKEKGKILQWWGIIFWNKLWMTFHTSWSSFLSFAKHLFTVRVALSCPQKIRPPNIWKPWRCHFISTKSTFHSWNGKIRHEYGNWRVGRRKRARRRSRTLCLRSITLYVDTPMQLGRTQFISRRNRHAKYDNYYSSKLRLLRQFNVRIWKLERICAHSLWFTQWKMKPALLFGKKLSYILSLVIALRKRQDKGKGGQVCPFLSIPRRTSRSFLWLEHSPPTAPTEFHFKPSRHFERAI